MKCHPLGIAAHLAIACDCMRRGDLDGAQAALARARELVGAAPVTAVPATMPPREPATAQP